MQSPKSQAIGFISWVILVCCCIIFRIYKGIWTRLYYFVTRRSPFDGLGSIENVVFVGGFLSFVPTEIPLVHYWGALGTRVAWAPKIGPISSMSDRACEVFYAVFGRTADTYIRYHHVDSHWQKKRLYNPVRWWVALMTFIGRFIEHNDPKDAIIRPQVVPESKGRHNELVFVGHSAGGGTINVLLDMLATHHKYLVAHKKDVDDLPPGLDDILEAVSAPVFVDDQNQPHLITPRSIKRVVYISSPLGGIEYACAGSKMNADGSFQKLHLGWCAAFVAKSLDMLFGRTNGVFYDFFLEQFENPWRFANGRDHIGRDFIGPNQRDTTDRAMKILAAYGIQQVRIITRASVPVKGWSHEVNLLRPGASVLLYPFASMGCGWLCDPSESKEAAYGPNDGVVSVASQTYGHQGAMCDCSARRVDSPMQCEKCGLWHIGVDHLEVIGTFDLNPKVGSLYANIFKGK